MIPHYINEEQLQQLISDAIREDIGEGDHATLAIFPENQLGTARMITREKGIIAGLLVAERILRNFDQRMKIRNFKKDGDPVLKDEVIMEIQGKVRAILSAERLTLNVVQRMSGIATSTHHLANKIAAYPVKLLDTRKTTPNFRMLEKWAVKTGGGENHRMGLYDMVMLKDNHIDFAGGIKPAIEAVKKYLLQRGKSIKIEVETRNLKEVKEVLGSGGIDIIMLDNMTVGQMKKALKLIDGRYKTEASGNITARNIEKIAACGIDYISVGAITHSAKCLDISLKTLI